MTDTLSPFIYLLVAALSYLGTRSIVLFAGQMGLIDQPNQRSAHSKPTPRGGGLAVISSFAIGLLVLSVSRQFQGGAETGNTWALLLPLGLVTGLTGLWDDRKSLSAKTRLLAQLAIGVLACYALFPMHSTDIPLFGSLPDAVLAGLALLGILWWLNLFNFMDGLDGLASSQAIFMLMAAIFTISFHSQTPFTEMGQTAQIMMLMIAAVFGFLIVNWHPARIFLGDCGSLSIGFMLFTIAMTTINSDWLGYHFWLIVGAAFVTDATLTLLTRIKKKERLTEAHRQHLYQILTDRAGWPQPQVCMSYLAFNLLVLLPFAFAAQANPDLGDIFLLSAYLFAGVGVTLGKSWAKNKDSCQVASNKPNR